MADPDISVFSRFQLGILEKIAQNYRKILDFAKNCTIFAEN
jgi:hypothetical protein